MRVVLTYGQRDHDFFHGMLRATAMLFVCSGCAALLYAGYMVADRHWYQSVEIATFETARATAQPAPNVVPLAGARLAEPPAESRTASPPAPIADADVIGEIEVPSVGLKAIVVQGDSENVLRRAVGHLPETPLPGEPGNVALAGHRDGLFRPLRDVQKGNAISLRTHNGDFQYRVEWVAIVSPESADVLRPTEENALTLVTCYPFNYLGAAPKRFVVRAREVVSEPEFTGTYRLH
jgi:sortase A